MEDKFLLYICITVFLTVSGCDWWPPGIDDIVSFNRERRLWLERNMQNYSVKQIRIEIGGPRATTLYVINGIPKYFCPNYSIYSSTNFLNSSTNFLNSGHIYSLDEFVSLGDTTLFCSGYFARMTVSEMYAELAKYTDSTRYKINIVYDGDHIPHLISIQSSSIDICWSIVDVRPIDPAMFEE